MHTARAWINTSDLIVFVYTIHRLVLELILSVLHRFLATGCSNYKHHSSDAQNPPDRLIQC